MHTVGDRIREKRIALGFGQPELAKLVGVSNATISFWETDKTKPNGKNLLRLALALKTSPEYILTGEEPEASGEDELDPRTAAISKLIQDVDEADYDAVVRLLLSLSNNKKLPKT